MKGITNEPIGYFDNYNDLADLIEGLGFAELSQIILKISQILQRINDANLYVHEDSQIILNA